MKRFTLLILSFSPIFLIVVLFPSLVVKAADPLLHNDYGVELLEKGEVEKAVEQLEKAHSLFALDQTLTKNLATAYTMLGKKKLEHKSFGEAAENFQKAETLFPDEPSYPLLRGIALYMSKNYEQARYELEKSRSLGGDTAESLYFLGRVYYDSGETDRALEYWEKAAAMAPSEQMFKELLDKMRRENAVESRMDRGHSSRFIVSYDSEVRSNIALKVLELLENSYNSVGADLGYFPEARIPVILYTRKDYKEVTHSPGWSGGLYDGKIRLPIGGLVEITPQLRATLRHEYTHAVIFDLTKGNCPTWFNEGIAEVQGRMEYNPPLPMLGKAVNSGKFLPVKTLEGSFSSLSNNEAQLAYEQSYAMVNFMVTAYGWYRVKEILLNLGTGLSIAESIRKGLSDFGLDYEGVLREWQEHMKTKFGGNRAQKTE